MCVEVNVRERERTLRGNEMGVGSAKGGADDLNRECEGEYDNAAVYIRARITWPVLCKADHFCVCLCLTRLHVGYVL
jgi:hypothetical protein